MKQEQMIRRLTKLRTEMGRAQLASKLGVRSATTIDNWINGGAVPDRNNAKARVEKFLASKEGKHGNAQ